MKILTKSYLLIKKILKGKKYNVTMNWKLMSLPWGIKLTAYTHI